MPSLLLFAEPAMGKTHILEKFLRDHRSGSEFGCSARVPIACVQMPPYPHERDFYQEVLTALGTVVPDGMSVVTLRHRVRILARQLQLRMLVVDEIHGMLQGSFREQRIFLSALRFLANDLRIPLVCLGTNEAKQALMTDQQLADRFEAFALPAWTDDGAFAQLLKSFGAILPLQKRSELWEPKMRKRILSLTDGVMGRVCRLLENAATLAIKTGAECIRMSFNWLLVEFGDRRSKRGSHFLADQLRFPAWAFSSVSLLVLEQPLMIRRWGTPVTQAVSKRQYDLRDYNEGFVHRPKLVANC